MPELTREQFLDLFHVWRDCYLSTLDAEAEAVRKSLSPAMRELRELEAERRRHEPASSHVFTCVCGVSGHPFNPEFERIHRPHIIAEALPRVQEGLERWRAYVRRTVEDTG